VALSKEDQAFLDSVNQSQQIPTSPSQVFQRPIQGATEVATSIAERVQSPPLRAGTDTTTGAPILTRALLSFFGTDEGKLEVLERKFGKGNARIGRDGSPQFLNPDTGQFTTIDPSPEGFLSFLKDLPGDLVDLLGEVAPVSGAIAGETGGGLLAGPTGAFTGGALGQASGQQFNVGVQQLAGFEGEEVNFPEQALIGATGVATGEILTRGLNKILGGPKIPVSAPRQALVERAEEAGIKSLTASQKTGSTGILATEERLGRNILGSAATDLRQKGVEEFTEFTERELSDKFGRRVLGDRLSNVKIGETAVEVFEEGKTALRNFADLIYLKVERELQGRVVPVDELENTLSLVLRQMRESGRSGRGEAKAWVLNTLEAIERDSKPIVESAANSQFRGRVSTPGRVLNMPELIAKTRGLNSIERDFPAEFPGESATRWVALIQESISTELKRFGASGAAEKEAVETLLTANDLYRHEIGRFTTETGGLLEKASKGKLRIETLARRLGQTGKKSLKITGIEDTERLLGKKLVDDLRVSFIQDLAKEASQESADGIKTISALKLQNIFKSLDREQLQTLLSVNQMKALDNISEITNLFRGPEFTQALRNLSGSGTAEVADKQIRDVTVAIGSLFTGGGAAAGGIPGGLLGLGGTLLGIKSLSVLDNALQKEAVVKWLTRGKKLAPLMESRLKRAAIAAVVESARGLGLGEEKADFFSKKVRNPLFRGNRGLR